MRSASKQCIVRCRSLFSNLREDSAIRSRSRRGQQRLPRWDRVHPVKRKFSNCQHTSSGRPSGTKFNFPRMTSGRPFHPSPRSAREPHDGHARARARMHTDMYIYGGVVRGLCPRKFQTVEEERSGSSLISSFSYETTSKAARYRTYRV